jgi:CheY-like chemotaxis protein
MTKAVKEGARILIMDDEESILEVTSEILTMFGYRVEVAMDGDEAVAKYRQALRAGERFDLVIMDLTIPSGMGGEEAIKELLKIDPTIRAIVSSGYAADPVVSDYRAHGFVGVIPKPYRMDELEAMIRKTLVA